MIPRTFLHAAFSFASATVVIAAQPDAGQILREQQSQSPREPARRVLPNAESAEFAKPALTESAVSVLVNAFTFSGYEGWVSEVELQSVVNDSVGKSLGLLELQAAVEKVNALFRQKGFFLTRAYLPKQDVTGGTIQITVMKACSDGGITVFRAPEVRLGENQIKGIADSFLSNAAPLRECDLERALLLMNDLPGVTARALLSPGSKPGTTHVTVNVAERPLISGMLWADNYGNRYTGSWRGNALLSLSDPFHIGDEFDFMLSGAEGLGQGRLSYSAPFGSRGFRANVAATGMQYKLIDGPTVLRPEGTARTLAAGASYPLIRQRSFTLSVTGGYEFKALIDKIFFATIRDKRVHNGNLGLRGEHSDSFGGGGFTTWAVIATIGDVDLSGNRDDALADKAGPKAAGVYTRVNLSASRYQRLTATLALYGSYYGQLASGNLDSSERFALGGPFGLRAYPVGEASGDEGHLFSLELKKDLGLNLKWGSVQLSAFADTGYTAFYKKPWAGALQTATGYNSYWLNDVGIGAALSKPGVYSVRLNYAHKMGGNPGRTMSGQDSDGQKSSGKFWVICQYLF